MNKMIERNRCLSCGYRKLETLSGGTFSDEPLHSFIANDPWGENPMPHIKDEAWSLVRCSKCSLKFHRHILSPEWNEIKFSKWMSGDAIRQFEQQIAGYLNNANAYVQHVLRLQAIGAKRVLDFGCGFGKFLEMCHLFGLDAVGVDRSEGRREGAGVEIVPELDDTEGQFDAISMFEVLEHLDDPLAMLNSLKKRLKPNGLMIVEVPDTTGVEAINSKDDYYKIHPLEHINAFTPETLVGIMGQAGFRPFYKIPAFVTTSPKRLAKDVAKAKLKKNSTQRYFTLSK
jgi:SAM-dependent methyltransferase